MHLYLNLKTLLLDEGDVADRLNKALDPPSQVPSPEGPLLTGPLDEALSLCARALTITLDLFEVSTVLYESEERNVAKALAEVIAQHSASHGFCICRGHNLGIWQDAVSHSRLPRLLHWPAFAVRPGLWRIFGHPLQAREADILNHLCRMEWSTSEQIALDGQVVSQRLRFTSATIPKIVRATAMGRVPHGPDGAGGPYPPDVWDIEQRLALMNREGLVTSPSPHNPGYRIVRPTPPPRQAHEDRERTHLP